MKQNTSCTNVVSTKNIQVDGLLATVHVHLTRMLSSFMVNARVSMASGNCASQLHCEILYTTTGTPRVSLKVVCDMVGMNAAQAHIDKSETFSKQWRPRGFEYVNPWRSKLFKL